MENQQKFKPGLIKEKFLFVSYGKIKGEIDGKFINGVWWIMDQQNFTDIIGLFKEGQCQNATIYTLKSFTIHKISIKISKTNQLQMGGTQTQQKNGQILLYQGGYRNYSRFGFGTIYYNQYGNDYEQWGYWNGQKQIGKFIKENYAQESQYSIIEYEEYGWKQMKFINSQRKLLRIDLNGINSQEKFTEEQYRKQIKSIQLYRTELLVRHRQQEFIVPLKKDAISYNKFDRKELLHIQKLTYDQCEIYLQYLFHQRESQILKRTAIIGLCAIDTQYKVNVNKGNAYKYIKEINRLMSKYSDQFALFGGKWERIVIPLVVSQIRDHYSFAVLNIRQMQCIYYDSIRMVDTNLYNGLIKAFLKNQGNKGNEEICSEIQNIKFSISFDVPEQFDSISCGYYMLWGISQLLTKEKVTFKNHQLSTIKQKIIEKLREINR